MDRRAFLLGSLLALPALSLVAPTLVRLAPEAFASTSRLITLDELVGYSTYVVVGTAGEHHSAWEDLPSGRRIITYTRVTVERAVATAPGHTAPTELWVRTLGGVVDKIGQAVPGEVQLRAGSRSLLFLTQGTGVVVVAAMTQGHYPIVTDEKGAVRLASSPDVGMLVARPGPSVWAHERLVGATLEDAAGLVQQARKARDANK
jgi:hypothetical protein